MPDTGAHDEDDEDGDGNAGGDIFERVVIKGKQGFFLAKSDHDHQREPRDFADRTGPGSRHRGVSAQERTDRLPLDARKNAAHFSNL